MSNFLILPITNESKTSAYVKFFVSKNYLCKMVAHIKPRLDWGPLALYSILTLKPNILSSVQLWASSEEFRVSITFLPACDHTLTVTISPNSFRFKSTPNS